MELYIAGFAVMWVRMQWNFTYRKTGQIVTQLIIIQHNIVSEQANLADSRAEMTIFKTKQVLVNQMSADASGGIEGHC